MTLAQPGGFVRVFVDLGPNMADLLGRLAAQGVGSPRLRRATLATPSPRSVPAHSLSRSYRSQHTPPNAAAMIEPLTRREQQVLELLAQRMTAQEIAQKLVLSDQTVKRHRANIYQKLGVHSRRDAIAAAVALGILPAAS